MENYYTPMPARAARSAGVTAAAIVAIALSALGVLSNLVSFAVMLFAFTVPAGTPVPGTMKAVLLATYGFFIALNGFGVATGIGLLRLRNWARISALVWAGLIIVFGLFGVLAACVIPQDQALPPEEHVVAVVAIGIFALGAIATGVWWLVLFNRRTVCMQFMPMEYAGGPNPYLQQYPYPAMQPAPMQYPSPQSAATPYPLTQPVAPLAVPMKSSPRAPVPVIVVACFMLMAIPGFLMMSFVPVPLLMFGHLIRGVLGRSLVAILGVVQAACGVGLLKLQSWAYWLALVVQGILVVNGTLTALDPHLAEKWKEIMSIYGTNMPNFPGTDPSLFISSMQMMMRFSVAAGALLTVVFLGLLIFSRKAYFHAVREAAATA